jgi:hypothetical protein
VKSHVSSQPEYLVAPEAIEITPLPQWIHSDIKTDVIRDAGLQKKISILDERAADRISEAFALSPWVERVAGVHTSYPAHIQVDLIYRRPTAMVEVTGGLLPVDAQCVLLPTAGFSTAEAHGYPRIVGITSSPRGLLGTPWGDATLERGVKLAAALQDSWARLGLRQIQALPTTDGDTVGAVGTVQFQIVSRGGTALLWGASPGEEVEGENASSAKLDRIEKLTAEYHSLDSVPKQLRDLRRTPAVN